MKTLEGGSSWRVEKANWEEREGNYEVNKDKKKQEKIGAKGRECLGRKKKYEKVEPRRLVDWIVYIV